MITLKRWDNRFFWADLGALLTLIWWVPYRIYIHGSQFVLTSSCLPYKAVAVTSKQGLSEPCSQGSMGALMSIIYSKTPLLLWGENANDLNLFFVQNTELQLPLEHTEMSLGLNFLKAHFCCILHILCRCMSINNVLHTDSVKSCRSQSKEKMKERGKEGGRQETGGEKKRMNSKIKTTLHVVVNF